MKSPWLIPGILALLLIVTNGAWFYANLDSVVTLSYRDQEVREHCAALKSCLALMPRIASAQTREQVLAAARAVVADPLEFEKDGAVWRGSIGLRFRDDRLAEAVPSWDPFECPR